MPPDTPKTRLAPSPLAVSQLNTTSQGLGPPYLQILHTPLADVTHMFRNGRDSGFTMQYNVLHTTEKHTLKKVNMTSIHVYIIVYFNCQ